MKKKTSLEIWFLFGTVILLFCISGQNVSAQREGISLSNAESVINKKCGSSAEIVLTETYKTGKVAHIYLFMDGKDFTKPKLEAISKIKIVGR